MSASKEKTTTRTAETVFGPVDYETVECASCGTEVRRESARRFVVGELQDRTTRGTLDTDQFEFRASSVQIGWACSHCREQGVFGFPENRLWEVAARYPMIFSTVMLAFAVLLLVILVAVVL